MTLDEIRVQIDAIDTEMVNISNCVFWKMNHKGSVFSLCPS